MNALLPRTTQDHVNFLWEPFATSTPLKIGPNNAKIRDLFHKQLLSTGSDNTVRKPLKRLSTSSILQNKLTESKQSTSKKAKKNKSSAYLDFSSSSSDEDSGETKRRPIIKVGSKKTRSLLSVKKLESEETLVGQGAGSACEKADTTKKVKNVRNNHQSPISTAADCEGRNVRGKNKGKSSNADADFKSSDDEECKIFDESNTKTVNSVKQSVNVVGDESVTENNKQANEREKIKKCKAQVKTTNANDNNTSKQLPSGASNNNKLSKLRKRKDLNSVQSARAVKKSSTKDKSPEENVENPITPLKLWGHKSNLSHQLFSDSREQEFINTLDLTSDDINEKITSSLNWGKATPSKQMPTNQDACKKDEDKQERPTRRKQKPKEYWMPENTSPTSVRESQTKKKSSSGRLPKQKEGDGLTGEIKENSKSKKVTGEKGKEKRKRKKGNVLREKKSNVPDDEEAIVTSTSRDEVHKHEMNQEKPSADVKVDEVIEERAVPTHKTVFQAFSELSFKENEMGCSVVQCQSMNNFKCGVLKLKVKSEFKCKTLHNNSHLGGVVVKGRIQMRVGEEELELTQGDMAFVPPLMEWQATNMGESESVFYYWCGRFK